MLTDTDLGTSTSRPAVGVPIHEAVLVDYLKRAITELFPPGSGRSTYVLLEPELGSGRPDLIVLTVSTQSVAKFRKSGLRLSSLTAARSLDSSLSPKDLGVTERYAASLRKKIPSQLRVNELRSFSSSIHEAIAIEAKMSDWRRATLQAARFQGLVDRAILVMPEKKAQNIPPLTLERYGLGVLIESGQNIAWKTKGKRHDTSQSNRLWLLELLIRGLENGTAYNASACRNSRIDSLKAPMRAE